MKPIGPLMIEHRLIERFVAIIRQKLDDTEKTWRVDTNFIDTAVDFFRMYADRTHHGKEEDILFRDLNKKELAQEHKRTMDELIKEHKHARATVSSLVAANERYRNGEKKALEDIMVQLRELISLYPAHIEKEDKYFFVPCMDYFTEQEQNAMLEEFYEFDRTMIHEKYQRLVEQLD
jgi:hemerythrin-like domain-containing protein